MKTLLPVIGLLLVLLAGCATGTGLETRLDPEVSMSELQTFRILPNHFQSPASPQSVAAAKRRIERAIQDTLVCKGYRRVSPGQPADFDVEYLMYVTERYQEGVHDRYMFDDRVHLLGGAEPRVLDPIREGTLHIHLLLNGKPIYEAIASDVIETGIAVDKRINTVVPRMLADIPVFCCH